MPPALATNTCLTGLEGGDCCGEAPPPSLSLFCVLDGGVSGNVSMNTSTITQRHVLYTNKSKCAKSSIVGVDVMWGFTMLGSRDIEVWSPSIVRERMMLSQPMSAKTKHIRLHTIAMHPFSVISEWIKR